VIPNCYVLYGFDNVVLNSETNYFFGLYPSLTYNYNITFRKPALLPFLGAGKESIRRALKKIILSHCDT